MEYLRDQARPGHPVADHACRSRSRWSARVEVLDAISGGRLTTEYRYHHGYWDGVEREFRGFAMVEQLDTETFDRSRPIPGRSGRALLAADA